MLLLGKGDAVWNPRGFSRALLSTSTANSKNECKTKPTNETTKKGRTSKDSDPSRMKVWVALPVKKPDQLKCEQKANGTWDL